MSGYLKIKNKNNFVRDTYSKAVINTDRDAFEKAKKEKEIFLKKENRINSLEEDVKELKTMIKELLSLQGKTNKCQS